MSMNVFELMAVLGINTAAYEAGLDKAQQGAEGFRGAVSGAVSKVAGATKAAMIAGGTAVAGFGVSATKTAMNFDSSMSQVAATMGYGVDELNTAGSEAANTYQKLSDFAQEMGAKTKFSASESADALNFMALAGYDAETSMQMLPNVLNLAAAGNMELADASDMVTDAQSALGLSLDETSQLVDKMAAASSKSNTSVSQLGSAILTVGGTAKNLAGGTTELSTALGLLADNGVKGAEGGTALRNIILSLSAPTEQAASLMEELGLQVFDAQGNMRPLQDIFEDLNGTLSTMTQGEQTQVLSELFNKVDLKSVNALMATNSERWAELSGAISDSAGAAQNMADVQLDNLAGDITILGSAWEGLQIAVRNAVDEQSSGIRKIVQFASNSLSEITQAINEGGLIGGLKAIGDIGKQSFSNLRDVVFGTTGEFEKLYNELDNYQVLARDVDGIADPFSAQGISVDALRESLKNANTEQEFAQEMLEKYGMEAEQAAYTWEKMGDVARNESEGIVGSVKKIVDNLVENKDVILEKGVEIVSSLMEGFRSKLDGFIKIGIEIFEWIGKGIEKYLPTFIDNWGKNLQTALSAIGENAPAILETAGNIITSLANGIQQAMPIVREAFVTILTNFGGWIEENLPSIMESGLKLIVGLTSSLRENIGPIIDAGLNFALSLAKGIADGLPALIENLPTIVSNIAGIINDNMPKILETGVKIIVTLAAGLIQAIPVIIENLPKIIMAIVDAFFAFNWASLGESIITGIGNGIKNLITHIPDLFKNITDETVNLVKSVNWADLGMSIIRFIGEGIQALFSAIPTALRTIGEEGFNLFKSIDWVGVGRSVIQFIGNGISALARAVPDALVSVGKSAIQAFKNIEWVKLGKNIIKGIVSGLKKNVDKVVNAITGIAGSALDAAKEFLGIASPSKKFRDLIGKPMAQGIAVGFTRGLPIKDMRDTLQNAMDFVSDIDMEDPFDDFGESLVNAAESFDINYPEDQFGIETIDIENDDNKRRIPIDQITFNIYPKESQDEQRIAEETMRIFTRWDEQQKAVYA